MGMFDDIRCEMPLPEWPEGEVPYFQTKDMDCALDHYTITKEGRLILDGKDRQHHGFLNFYTSTKGGDWYEYNAKFTDGTIVEITGGKEALAGRNT
jgi:hypothetical protein